MNKSFKKDIKVNQNKNKMKKHIRTGMILATFFTLSMTLPASGQAPPPPAHGQNGNQVSPGGSGCPIDRTQGILLTLFFSLGCAGSILYQRGKREGI
jgi:hypothetical protein